MTDATIASPVTPNQMIPPLLEQNDQWTDRMLEDTGIPVTDMPFVSVGGGMGSFITVDYLRVAGGMPASQIRVLSNLSQPWQTYEYLARVSQLPRAKRIRSDSASRPDNIWGFPSFALQEAVQQKSLRPLLQVLVEPVFANFYTPVLGTLLDGIEREAHRIGYWDMLVQGDVQLVRRRAGSGYFTLLAPRAAGSPQQSAELADLIAFRSRDVHLAMGYPGLRFLPDLQDFRERMNDFHHVVNGYEDHEHVYEALRRKPGVVLIRGGGIVASAVLDRLINDRLQYGSQTQILHLFRTYFADNHGPHPWARRRGRDGFAYQGFNYPKSAWGGQLKARMRRLEGADRVRMYNEIGGTTTAWRRHWQRGMRAARRGGWYRAQAGMIVDLQFDESPGDSALAARVRVPAGELDIKVDYIIDCTGLESDMAENQVLRDLLQHGGATRNPLGRLDVERNFQVRGADSGYGRLYATGAASFGGYFPGVDTFLGLQISAQEVVDDIAERGYCHRMGPMRSIAGWLRWISGRQVQ